MIDKQLNQKAKEYANDTFRHCIYSCGGGITDFDARMEGFISGANYIINLPQDFSELSDKEIRKIRDECVKFLNDRRDANAIAINAVEKVLSIYFNNDIKRLAFISETDFKKYNGINNVALVLVKKEMARHNINFLNE